jgi:hypothetical protein
MNISTEFSIAIAVAVLSLIGTVSGYFISARKSEVDALSTIIERLRERIEELELANSDLEDWAERLVNQVKDLGGVPERLIRHRQGSDTINRTRRGVGHT